MKTITRRDALKLASAGTLAALSPEAKAEPVLSHDPIPVWEVFELTLPETGPGNPFTDVALTATFSVGHRSIEVDGFYDGEGIYKIRFMPDTPGEWSYKVSSSLAALDDKHGSFVASPPLAGVHGPVRTRGLHHFGYADGTPFFPFGTTCYAWVHQNEALQQQTLETLRDSPFTKIRMCIFPKSYEYNHNEPELYPFDRDAAGVSDFSRPNPAFFRHIEQRIADLRALGIEADLILFHPYDRWGYSTMPPQSDDRYLRYVLARFSAYRNIWWSMANEYDLMRAKSSADFDRLFHVIEAKDPYAHLRSIHFSRVMYDYGRPWITHASLQNSEFATASKYIADWRKPVMFDEVMYEGNLNRRWGNISGEELSRKFWLGVIAGCYVTHGETYLVSTNDFDENATPTLWWAHGGKLHGTSPAQIAFLRKLLEETAFAPEGVRQNTRAGLEPADNAYYLSATAYKPDGKTPDTLLYYFDFHQPVWYEFVLPEGTFAAEWIDPVAMTATPRPGRFTGKAKLQLPGRPFQALRFRAVASA